MEPFLCEIPVRIKICQYTRINSVREKRSEKVFLVKKVVHKRLIALVRKQN